MFVRMCVMFFVDIGDHWRRLQGELFGSASMRPSVWRSVRYQWVCSSVPRAKCGHLWPSGAKMCYTVLLRFTKMGSTQRVSFRTCLLQSAFKSWSFQASWLIVSTAARTVEEDLVVSAQVPITSHNQILSLWFQDISRHFKPVRSFAVAQEWALPVHDTKRHELDHGLCGGGRRSGWRSQGAHEFLRWREITIASIASVGWGDVRKFLRKNIRKDMEGLYLEHSWTFLNILEHCRSNPKIPQDPDFRWAPPAGGDILSCWCTALGYQAILSNGGGPADAQDQSSSSP